MTGFARILPVAVFALAACPINHRPIEARQVADGPSPSRDPSKCRISAFVAEFSPSSSSKAPEELIKNAPEIQRAWRQKADEIRRSMELAMGPLVPEAHCGEPVDFDALSKRLGIRIHDRRNFDGYDRLEMSFDSGFGERVPCFLLTPTDPERPGDGRSKKRPAVLALHQTTPHGKAEVADETIDPKLSRPSMRYGVELARRGFVVIAPDYPSFGKYPCEFTRGPFISGTMRGIVNHMRCVAILQSRQEVDPRRIGAIGHSLGGHNAIFVAAFDERIKAVVSCCGWCPFADYYGGRIKGWTSDRYMPRLNEVYHLDVAKIPFEFDEAIALLAPRAFLSISPVHDSNFSVEGVKKGIRSAERVYRLLGKPQRLQALYPDCEHDFTPEMRQAAYRFLENQLNASELEGD